MSAVVGIAPDEIQIGMPVRAKIQGEGADAVLLFEPA